MNGHVVALILGALLAAPATAAAQGGVRAEVHVESEAGVGRGTGTREEGPADLATTLAAAVRAGLPEAPVRRAAATERARGASREAVARAAVRTHGWLVVSRDALTEGAERAPSGAEITAGARALAAGASEEDLLTVAGSAPASRDLSTSLDALARLRGEGVSSAEATTRVATALRGGASDRALTALGRGGRASTGVGAGAGAAVRAGLGSGARVSGMVGGGLRLP